MIIRFRAFNWSLLALAALAAASGCCCQAIPLPGEKKCPTDARRLYWSFGEEAVRRCPCGPSSQYYGYKPTCWREWPAGWQCNGMPGMPYVDQALFGQPPSVPNGEVISEEAVLSTPAPADDACLRLPLVEEPSAAAGASPQHAQPQPSTSAPKKPAAAELPTPPQTPQPKPALHAPQSALPANTIPPEPTTSLSPNNLPNLADKPAGAPQPAVSEPPSTARAAIGSPVLTAFITNEIQPTGSQTASFTANPTEATNSAPVRLPSTQTPAAAHGREPGLPPQKVSATPLQNGATHLNQAATNLPDAKHNDELAQARHLEQHIQNNLEL